MGDALKHLPGFTLVGEAPLEMMTERMVHVCALDNGDLLTTFAPSWCRYVVGPRRKPTLVMVPEDYYHC